MNLLLLGGNSPTNQPWLRDLGAALQLHFTAVCIHTYRHWQTGEKLINLDNELDVLKPEEPYSIVAKSAGVLLTLKGVAEGMLKPQQCVFIGTPILWAQERYDKADAWLLNYSVLTLFIQQSHDPVTSYEDLKTYLEQAHVKNSQLFQIPGKDHDYGNIDQLTEVITSFITPHA